MQILEALETVGEEEMLRKVGGDLARYAKSIIVSLAFSWRNASCPAKHPTTTRLLREPNGQFSLAS